MVHQGLTEKEKSCPGSYLAAAGAGISPGLHACLPLLIAAPVPLAQLPNQPRSLRAPTPAPPRRAATVVVAA